MIEKFRTITAEMASLYERKNSDYGNSIHDTFVKYGPAAYLVRMEDKINRVRSLTLNNDQRVENEKVRDTLIDLANYSILMLMELEEANEVHDRKICHESGLVIDQANGKLSVRMCPDDAYFEYTGE